jgi:TetR/AcrR family transcriptional regulator, cholesterol catabolism regulator
VVTVIDSSPGRERVLDAAAERFVVQGYAATTLRQIAGDVGIKAGSIYHHFASKEELFASILREGIDVMVEAFERVEADLDAAAEPRARLAAHVRAHLGALFEHGPFTANHVTAFFTAPPEVRADVVPHRDAYEARWAALLDGLQAAGAIRAGLDTGLLRLTLFGAMNWSIEWFDPTRGNLDEFSEEIVDQFWNGVRA